MPKLPRDLSHDEHTILAKRHEQVAVPRHARLKTGTIAAILRQAGISRDRLERLR